MYDKGGASMISVIVLSQWIVESIHLNYLCSPAMNRKKQQQCGITFSTFKKYIISS